MNQKNTKIPELEIMVVNPKAELARIDMRLKRIRCFYFISAAHHLDMANLYRETAKPTTLKDAESTVKLISLFITEKLSPYDFIPDVDETTNKSIDEYKIYKEYLDACPFENKKYLTSFSQWFTHSQEAALLRVRALPIIYISYAVVKLDNGIINKSDFLEYLNDAGELHKHSFLGLSLNNRKLKKFFILASNKINQIEKIINKRKEPTINGVD